MKTMRLTFGDKTFQALVDMEKHVIFSADIWHLYCNGVCSEYEDAPVYNFHDYVDEVLYNGGYYTSESFAYYNPWESDDCYQLYEDDEENMTGESWTLFIDGIARYCEDDFFEQLSQIINQCYFKTETVAAVKRNKKNSKNVRNIA